MKILNRGVQTRVTISPRLIWQREPGFALDELYRGRSILCLGKIWRKTFPAAGRGCAVALTGYGGTRNGKTDSYRHSRVSGAGEAEFPEGGELSFRHYILHYTKAHTLNFITAMRGRGGQQVIKQ